MSKCYFCDSEDIVIANEHYTFCRNCMALYTFMIVHEKDCDHINQGCPLAMHEPVYKSVREGKPYIAKERVEENRSETFCSKCCAYVYVDGW
ncbi:MAG: hypothetical protein PVG39_07860 [Desulfobacteraceae bacterium]|jgi:hypothetical protein